MGMAKRMVDRIRKALGLRVRIPGAAYSDEWWGDIPPAAPQAVIAGVNMVQAGVEISHLRSIIETPPAKAPQADPDEDEWEVRLRAARARTDAPEPTAWPRAVTLHTAPSAGPTRTVRRVEIHPVGGSIKAGAAAVRAVPDDGWDAVIRDAKARVAAPVDESETEDWDVLIRRAKLAGTG
jgi:hypothetical protein